MKGIKNFVIGFSLSFISVSLGGQLYCPLNTKENPKPAQHIAKINLFNSKSSASAAAPVAVFAKIDKQSLAQSSEIPDTATPAASATSHNTAGDAEFNTALSFSENEGIEDVEILSINIDDTIPIEYGGNGEDMRQAEILYGDSEDKVAMLPTRITDEETYIPDSPWVIAQGSKHVKNKKILEKYGMPQDTLPVDVSAAQELKEDSELSYKVAERIKQSIIFPIPDEILNDENLTPTFIKAPEKKAPAAKKKPAPAPKKKETPDTASNTVNEDFKILPKNKVSEENKDGLLGSISSWFSGKSEPENKSATPAPRPAPSYSSQGELPPKAATSDATHDLISFYETLQETKNEYAQKRILPSELKLSFQPGRAEISGQTLNWLKTFSEATKDGSVYLQVRLDASASTELQRKRLNLLYTIFMNNGVDFNKIDTVFSSTEPNAFIIRTLKVK